jgi:hypothetical protein
VSRLYNVNDEIINACAAVGVMRKDILLLDLHTILMSLLVLCVLYNYLLF